MLTAQKAFQMMNSGVPDIAATVAGEVKAGRVSKVFKGDLDARKKVSPTFLAWLTTNNLISTDASLAKKVGGGGTHGASAAAIKAAVGADFDAWIALKDKINKVLVAKNIPWELQPYVRNLKPTPPATK